MIAHLLKRARTEQENEGEKGRHTYVRTYTNRIFHPDIHIALMLMLPK